MNSSVLQEDEQLTAKQKTFQLVLVTLKNRETKLKSNKESYHTRQR